jgi:beta-fructofuranosidase
MRKHNINDKYFSIWTFKVDVELLFDLPELENGEWLEDPSEVDPQLLCSKQYESRSGKIGPFGLLALASKDLTEQTAVFFQIYRTSNRFVCLMCSDQSRLFLTSSNLNMQCIFWFSKVT